MLTGPTHGNARVVMISRSDGRLYANEEINARKGAAIKQVGEIINEDTSRIDDQETRGEVLRWKIITGTGLADELAWPRDSQYHLIFPDRFVLRWHKTDCDDGQLCMYGHPAGCSDEFLYKEPYEFTPHLLWLLSESNDRKACPCKPCHRATGRKIPRTLVEKLHADIAAKQAAAEKPVKKIAPPKAAGALNKKRPGALAAATEAATKPKESPVPKTIKKNGSKAASAAAAQQASPAPPAAARPSAPSTPVQTPAPAAQVMTPVVQSNPVNNEPTLFRRGEMVWYQQDPAWRIGIIRQVGAAPANAYTIIPLGHSLLKMQDLVKQQAQMRPFLTFSVPGVGIESIQSKIFSEVQWQELIASAQGRSELIGLEASKMAALEIDSSWSVFNRLPADPTQPRNQSRYDGVFLGAEMIRRGDPVRNKDKSKGTLLEVSEILVTTTTSVPNPGAPANTLPTTQDILTFRGVEFEAALVPEATHVPKQPQGAIFSKDTVFRTAAAKAGGQTQKCIWTIKSWDATWQEREVAGRSYVTDELINVTQGAAAVQQALQTGKFTEAQAFLNNRMQNTAARNMARRLNRRMTLGHAVYQAQPLILGEGVVED